jgi:hypothetical protein
LGSIFRNATGCAQRYADQIALLRHATPRHTIRPVLVEGDSEDCSWDMLNALFPGCVTKREHGGPVFGSVDSAQRYRQFSYCYEGVLERLTPDDDLFIYVEGDLIWTPETMLALMADLEKPNVDMVSPFCSFQNRHYDIWAVRALNGEHVGFFPPYHVSMLDDAVNGLHELSAAGSCVVMKGDVARGAHFLPEDLCIVGFCHEARKMGYRLWWDKTVSVHHPE